MTEDQAEQTLRIKEQLWCDVHNLVDARLKGVDPVVEDSVREQLTEQFRFWKRGV